MENDSRRAQMEVLFEGARTHEKFFRAVLRDIKEKLSGFVPSDLDPDSLMDQIIDRYCKPPLSMGFGITEFEVGPYNPDKKGDSFSAMYARERNLKENEAVIGIQNFAPLSGRSFALKYGLNPDGTVVFKGQAPGMIAMS
jgi:hypothetical protein